jgi:hypothetical protein
MRLRRRLIRYRFRGDRILLRQRMLLDFALVALGAFRASRVRLNSFADVARTHDICDIVLAGRFNPDLGSNL